MRVIKPPASEGQRPHAWASTPPEAKRDPPSGRVYPDLSNADAVRLGTRAMAYVSLRVPYLQMEIAGSVRRGRPVSHDIDILISPPSMELRKTCERIGDVLWSGPEKVSVDIRPWPDKDEWVQVDFRFINLESWGAALQYFTGSRDHNISLRAIAKRRGLTLNEYGLWRLVDGTRVDDGTEEGIYKALGLRWFPPRFREGAIGDGGTPEHREAARRERLRERREAWDERQRRLTALYRGETL